MGTVYEAEEDGSGRRVALKLIAPRYGASPDAVERFRREGRLAGLIVHPRCVFVLAADEEAGRPYLVMELMPGDTLHDLVRERGPLLPGEAVSRALDVIAGLQEAHRHGIVHRDVKPSNCFLDPAGRVKVGDFGLARSLLAGADLTRTGSFLGTPLFASPEQLKGAAVDVRSDVYSVSATLYYLLTGRAPFEGADAAAVAARVASEPAPPLRPLRPDLPRDLEKVVLRGLERDPRRRWHDLDDLRAALVRFEPGRLSIGDVWVRAVAYLIDYAVVAGVWLLLHQLLRLWWPDLPAGPNPRANICSGTVDFEPGPTFISAIPDLLYFGLLEGLWGCGLGKWLLSLRVTRAGSTRAPGVPRALLRAAVFCLLMYLPRHLVALATFDCLTGMLLSALAWWNLGGLLLVASTMRWRNGYRGLHDFASGTSVLRASWTEKGGPERVLRRDGPARLPRVSAGAAVFPAAVGPFSVRWPVAWADGGGVLLGEDAVLGREVLLWLRPAGEPPLAPARRGVNRPGRLRWLAGGAEGRLRWDAFVAEGGRPLPDFVADEGALGWEAARELLRQLADELAAACADGTLPPSLSPVQVVVRPDGHVLLLDMRPSGPEDEPATADAAADKGRALALLSQVAVLALEGQGRAAGEPPVPVRAPLPLHASRVLARLVGAGESCDAVEDFQRAMAESEEWPARVGRSRRAIHLLIQSGLLLAALFLALVGTIVADGIIARCRPPGSPSPTSTGTGWVAFGLVPVAGVVWAFLARGGPSFGLCGIALVRADGNRAGRRRAALRCALAWAQGGLLFFLWMGLLVLGDRLAPAPAKPEGKDVANIVELVVAVAYAVLVVWLPRRTLHDRLAGTYLVPK